MHHELPGGRSDFWIASEQIRARDLKVNDWLMARLVLDVEELFGGGAVFRAVPSANSNSADSRLSISNRPLMQKHFGLEARAGVRPSSSVVDLSLFLKSRLKDLECCSFSR